MFSRIFYSLNYTKILSFSTLRSIISNILNKKRYYNSFIIQNITMFAI